MSPVKHTESSGNALTCQLTVNITTGRINLRLTSLDAATHDVKAKGSKVCCDFCWVFTQAACVVVYSLKGLMFMLCAQC